MHFGTLGVPAQRSVIVPRSGERVIRWLSPPFSHLVTDFPETRGRLARSTSSPNRRRGMEPQGRPHRKGPSMKLSR